MKILSIISLRSGTGKTTIALNLAYELSKNNKKVLLVNFDYKQIGFILSPEKIDQLIECDYDLVDFFSDDFDIRKRIIPTMIENKRFPNLDLLISNYSINENARAFLLNFSRKDIIFNNLKKLDPLYDYIIIDTPSEKTTDSIIIKNLVFASDLIISPFTDNWESIKLSEKLLDYVNEINGNSDSLFFIKNNFDYDSRKSPNIKKTIEDLTSSKKWNEEMKFIDFELEFSVSIVDANNKKVPVSLLSGSSYNVGRFQDLAYYINKYFDPVKKPKNVESISVYEIQNILSNNKELKEEVERFIFEKNR